MNRNRKTAWVILALQAIVYAVLISIAGCQTTETSIRMTVQSTVQVATGSGVVIAPNTILTARHVVDGLHQCTVIDNDGTEYESVMIYTHETEDAALVILAKSVLTPVKLGTREQCHIGQSVYIVGTPYGDERLFNIVSGGVISTLSRDYGVDPGGENTWDDIILIDGFIHPGNSGGPVSIMNGLCIGIVSGNMSGTNITL